MTNAAGGVTHQVWDQLNRVYDELDNLVALIGLEYDLDTDEYVCDPSQVDEEWCDRELLDSIDALHGDLKYFLNR